MRLVSTVMLLVALALSSLACNKSRPRVLDYQAEGRQKRYRPVGLPGQSHVGAPGSATRFSKEGAAGTAAQTPEQEDGQQTKRKPPQDK